MIEKDLLNVYKKIADALFRTGLTSAEVTLKLLILAEKRHKEMNDGLTVFYAGKGNVKSLSDYIEKTGGSLLQQEIDDTAAKKFEIRLRAEAIPFFKMQDEGSTSTKFLFNSIDAEAISMVSQRMIEERFATFEIPSAGMLEYADEDKGIQIISGLTPVQLEAFRSVEKDFSYAVLDKHGKHPRIAVRTADMDKATMALDSALLSLTDNTEKGKEYEALIANRKTFASHIKNEKVNVHVVDAATGKVHLHIGDKLTMYKDGNVVDTMNRSDEQFVDRVYLRLNGIEQPVLLSEEQYETFKLRAEKGSHLEYIADLPRLRAAEQKCLNEETLESRASELEVVKKHITVKELKPDAFEKVVINAQRAAEQEREQRLYKTLKKLSKKLPELTREN